MPMGPTKGTEMKLQMIVRRHSVSAIDFGRTKKVMVTTFVSAKKLSAGERRPNFAHTLHVQGTLKEGKIPVQGQDKTAGNTGVLSI